jgi:predicted HicB family RNase H-like nuclease
MEQERVVVKTDMQLKAEAATVAKELGVSLNAVINNELKRLVAERDVHFYDPTARQDQRQRSRVYHIRVTNEVSGELMARAKREGLSFHMLLRNILYKAAYDNR